MTIHITQPLRLYRAILRETTYLFDRKARTWTQEYVRASFRKNAAKIRDDKGLRTVPYESTYFPSKNERHLLKRGRRFLLLLQRANQCYQRHLRTLLQLAYGRKGREKRALTAPLMQPSLQTAAGSSDEAKTLPVLKSTPESKEIRFTKDWKAPSDFLTILNAQSQLSAYLSIRKALKPKPPVDEKNRWGRPMPPSRVKNITRKWYAKMAGVLMPPVPEAEWERLRSIVLRKQEFRQIPRRPTARSEESKQAEGIEQAASTLLSGTECTSRRTLTSIKTPHKMTPRFLSRFYAKHILNHTPVAVPNPNGKGLVSKWDDGKRYVMVAERPKNSAQTEALFG